MLLHSLSRRRYAVTLVECALVYPAVFVLFIGLLVGGMGVYRYQEVASLARRAARFASTHAGKYAKENANAATVNKSYIITNVINAHAVSIDTSKVQTQISITTSSGTYDWDNTSKTNNRWPVSIVNSNGTLVPVTNTVSVTVTYPWVPECYLLGPINLSSTSVMPICY